MSKQPKAKPKGMSDSDYLISQMTRACRAAFFDYETGLSKRFPKDAKRYATEEFRVIIADAFCEAWEELASRLHDITDGP